MAASLQLKRALEQGKKGTNLDLKKGARLAPRGR